jgi:hypothetical protein
MARGAAIKDFCGTSEPLENKKSDKKKDEKSPVQHLGLRRVKKSQQTSIQTSRVETVFVHALGSVNN